MRAIWFTITVPFPPRIVVVDGCSARSRIMVLHHRRHGHRWITLVVLLIGLLPMLAVTRIPQAASAAPAGLHPADWQAIQAQIPITQQAYLKAANPGAGDEFGISVAASGDTVVVGAREEDSSSSGVNSIPNEAAPDAGAAYVFVRSGSTWTQQAYLKASNPGAGDWFGWEVAISGNTVVVAAVYEDSSSSGVNSTPNEAAPFAGAAYVFTRSGTTWTQQAYLKASNPGAYDRFGWGVAASGDTVVVGAFGEDSSSSSVNIIPNEAAPDAGAAYVFVRSGSTWTQQAYLKAANPGAGDEFGWRVAASGNTVVVGARGEDSSSSGVNATPNDAASAAGAAYVFTGRNGLWTQQAYLKASNPEAGDEFGTIVAVSGDTIVVGAHYEDSSTSEVNAIPNERAPQAGAAYVFRRLLNAAGRPFWTQEAYLKASNAGVSDMFGSSVAIDGTTIVVGASGEYSSSSGVNCVPNEAAVYAGAAYVFRRGLTLGGRPFWTQEAYLKASNPGAEDRFGWNVAVSGTTVIIGAQGEDSSSSGVNSVPNEAAPQAGATYLFAVPTP